MQLHRNKWTVSDPHRQQIHPCEWTGESGNVYLRLTNQNAYSWNTGYNMHRTATTEYDASPCATCIIYQFSIPCGSDSYAYTPFSIMDLNILNIKRFLINIIFGWVPWMQRSIPQSSVTESLGASQYSVWPLCTLNVCGCLIKYQSLLVHITVK